MNKTLKGWSMAVVVLPVLLSACVSAQNPARVELPQQYRLPQASLVTTFEKRSGRIALIDDNGDLVVMDQTGGGVVKITRDAANVGANQTSAGSRIEMAYRWPVWSPDGGQIAFVELTSAQPLPSRIIETGADSVTVQHGDNSIVILQTEQGQLRQSPTNSSLSIRQPGRVIIERDTTPTVLASSVYVAVADGKQPLREVYASNKGAVGYLDWSPDNTQLAFLAESGDQETTLTLVSKDAAAKPRVLATGATAAWQWHPDGNSLVAKIDANMTDYTADLTVLDTHTDKTTATIAQKADMPFRAPAFSPDGNAIMYTVQEDGKDYLALADRQGKLTRRLVQIDGPVSFSWSPASAKVAYIVQQPRSASTSFSTLPSGALHVLDVNSGEDRMLSQLPVAGFFWAPDGAHIAAFSPMSPASISRTFPGMDLTGNQPTSVLMLQTIDIKTDASRQLFYFEPTSDFSRMLLEYDRFSHGVTIWSPDSRSLVFPMIYTNSQTGASNNVIMETEASGSIEPRYISPGSMAVWSPK